MTDVSMRQMLEAGVHFGHQSRKWNPRMRPYILGERQNVHIINLEKTAEQLDASGAFLRDLVSKGKKILFVGCKRQAQDAVREAAEATGQYYVNHRWLGGTLTNLPTVRRSVGRMESLENLQKSPDFKKMSKKEIASLNREKNKLHLRLSGIRKMDRLPDAMVIVASARAYNAINEARQFGLNENASFFLYELESGELTKMVPDQDISVGSSVNSGRCTLPSGASSAKPALRTAATAPASVSHTLLATVASAIFKPAGVAIGCLPSKGTRYTPGMARALRQIALRPENLLQSRQLKTQDEAWQYYRVGLSGFLWLRSEYYLSRRAELGTTAMPDLAYSRVPGPNGALTPLTTTWAWAITTSDPARQALAVGAAAWLWATPMRDSSLSAAASAVDESRVLTAVGNAAPSWLRGVPDRFRSLLNESGLPDAIGPYGRGLLYTSPSPRDRARSRMPSSA